MNVLSLFDGMSCSQIALNRIGIEPEAYYASEIDKYAIKVTQHNYPDTIQLGDVTKWKEWDIPWEKIDLITAGFPCQTWSVAGKQMGDRDERGMLFWTMLDIAKKVLESNPNAKFLFENVKMKKDFEQYITHHTEQALGKINKYLINSSLVSAQNRNRYYWSNIDGVEQPEDKNIMWDSIAIKGAGGVYYVTEKMDMWINKCEKRKSKHRIYELSDKSKMQMLEWSHHKGISNQRNFSIRDDLGRRYIHPLECERLQTVPDNYTQGVSNTQRYKMLGNGFTVDVIAHILKNITT